MTNQKPVESGESEKSRAIVWMAWGQEYVKEAKVSLKSVKSLGYPKILITDEETLVALNSTEAFDHVVTADFDQGGNGLLAKSEMWKWLPDQYNSFLFLDTDTRVLGDIEYGFQQAEKHEMAIVPAAHYCLDHFWEFGRVMEAEGTEQQGQLQYNTGVIFFTRTPRVEQIFGRWKELASRYAQVHHNDQPYLTLAMYQEDFRPYALSPNYNYRGMGVPMIGEVRIWHTPHEPPEDLNDQPGWWPMRYFVSGSFHRPGFERRRLRKWGRDLLQKVGLLRYINGKGSN